MKEKIVIVLMMLATIGILTGCVENADGEEDPLKDFETETFTARILQIDFSTNSGFGRESTDFVIGILFDDGRYRVIRNYELIVDDLRLYKNRTAEFTIANHKVYPHRFESRMIDIEYLE